MPTVSAPFLTRAVVQRAGVLVVSAADTLMLVAARPYAAGATILRLEGRVVDEPSRFTVELGPGRHLDAEPGSSERERMTRAPWLYLNHACAPNTRLDGADGRSLVALVDVAAGDELTFDYEANETRMAEPFRCGCGSCGGRMVRGFALLDAAERAARAGRLSPHLREG